MMRRFQILLSGLSGGVFGLASARYLFETQPAQWEVFNTWPGALALGLLTSALTLALAARWPRTHTASLALLLPLLSLFAPEVNLLRAETLLIGALTLFALLSLNLESWNLNLRLWDLGLGIFLFILYLRTLAPTVGEADSFEFQVGVARLGIAHGSGYPLLLLLGKAFALLPLGGTLAWRANLVAALFGALSGVGAWRLARRLGAEPPVAWLAGLALGTAPSLWARSTEIEAYTLNTAFAAAILWLCLTLVEKPTPSSLKNPAGLYVLAFVFGLGLTNHLTTLMLAPACGVAVWVSRQHFPSWAAFARAVGLAVLCGLAGLLVYLYLPLRWPAVNHGELLTLERFLYILKGGEAVGYFDPFLPFRDWARYASVGRKLMIEFGAAGLALAGVGVAAFMVKPVAVANRSYAIFIFGLAYAGHLYFVIANTTREPDWGDFFLTLYLIMAVFMALGLQAVLDLTRRFLKLERWSWSLGLVLFALIPLSSIWTTWPKVDRSQVWEKFRWGQYTLGYPLAENATVLSDPAHLAPLYYLQVAEGQRPDLDIVILPDEASYRAVLDERLAAGGNVYLARYLPGLGSGYSLRSVGPLAEVSPTPFMAPVAIAQPLTATLAGNLRLLGYETDAESLTLFWHAEGEADNNYLVTLRLLDESGQSVWQSAGSVPVNGLYPTNAWRPGETVSDFYALPHEPSLAPGIYQLQVGLFPPFRVAASGWADVSSFTVTSAVSAPQPSHPLRAHFGSQILVGCDAPESAAPGAQVQVTLYWERSAAQDTVTALGETRSLAAWPVGAVVPVKYTLTAPLDGNQLPLLIQTEALAQCGWLAPLTAACALPTVQLSGAAVAEGAIIFDNQMVLRQATIKTPAVGPGGVVQVALQWHALKTITENYTVFVHLLGPDGQVYGQVDYWPVGGTLGTAQWRPGQVIDDPYQVTLAPEAPPGEYQVEIGFYLLETLARLPVLNREGTPIDDKVLISGLRVP